MVPRQWWIRTQEAPYEIWIAAAVILFALYAFASPRGPFPPQLVELFDNQPHHWVLQLWAATLGVGGLLVLIGRYRSALNAESAGLLMITSAIGLYAFASGIVTPAGLYAALVQGSLAVATAIRLWVVRRAVKAGRREWHGGWV